ncbi:hypothetical protein V8F33_001201 [Rhypophila sp. PSN 637]
MSSSAVLRDACDACHARKTRCPSEGVGACGNCRRTGQVCQFSPRSEMGRPKLGSSSSRRRHSERMNSRSSKMGMGNVGIMTTTTPPPTPSLETNMVTGHPLLLDHYQTDAVAYSIDETSTTGRDAEMDNTYMETQPSLNSMSVTSSTLEDSRHSSRLVPTTSSWGSMIGPLTDTPTVISDLYMLDNSWMTSTSSPAIPIIRDQTYGAKAATPSASSTSSSSSRRSPAFPPSSSIPIPSMGAVTGATAYINKTNGLLEAYSQLSHILYSLRNLPSLAGDQQQQSSSDQRRAVDQTFALVSSLCDILTWLGNDQGATGGELPPYLLLVASVLASVMDIYHKTGEAHKRELQLAVAHDNLDHRHHQQQQQAKSNTTSTHQHAVILSDMTIMEFHLARLQLTLGETQLAASDDYTQTLTRLEHVRAFLRIVIDDFHVGVRD